MHVPGFTNVREHMYIYIYTYIFVVKLYDKLSISVVISRVMGGHGGDNAAAVHTYQASVQISRCTCVRVWMYIDHVWAHWRFLWKEDAQYDVQWKIRVMEVRALGRPENGANTRIRHDSRDGPTPTFVRRPSKIVRVQFYRGDVQSEHVERHIQRSNNLCLTGVNLTTGQNSIGEWEKEEGREKGRTEEGIRVRKKVVWKWETMNVGWAR